MIRLNALRWIGFFEDDAREIAEGADIRRRSRIVANALRSRRGDRST